MPGLEVTSLNIFASPAGLQLGVLESKTGSGGVMTYEKRVYFRSKAGVAYVWLTTGETLKLTILPLFDALVDTVRLLP